MLQAALQDESHEAQKEDLRSEIFQIVKLRWKLGSQRRAKSRKTVCSSFTWLQSEWRFVLSG